MTTFVPSLWLSDTPRRGPDLQNDVHCEVVVVGAGYTGLSAAIALADAGVDAVVLEAEYAGFGASGRNAGHLTPTIGKDLPSVLKMYGPRTGGALARLADEAVEHTEDTIKRHGIDCDYVPNGNLIAGIHPGHEKRLRAAVAAAGELGASVRMVERDELDARGIPAFVNCAALEERGGVLDPGRYVRGLRKAALRAGARIYEGTPALTIDEHVRGVRISTPRASVSAATVVLATNAHTPQMGLRYGHVTPVNDCLFVTEPLTEEQRDRIGWNGSEGIYTAHEALENYRITADGRISGGSRYVGYRYGGRFSPDDQPRTFAKIERNFRARFPELADLPMAGFWSGHIAMNLNFLPFIGRVGRHERIVAALGYCGHGVALAGLLGTVAAGIAIGSAQAPAVLTQRRRIPMPPDPLRWLGVKGLAAALEALDRRTDRLATPRH
ncbi:FAD-binding oxidoreductase [Mycobacterium sp. TY815]|uniref:NAD(P)/FAD-dependent oxidoreductase n=1 Tax=Mycobacterium sp. TY815 TaxID=3050581 RepID=UPI00274136ED|nr:FAD-binding oxidoreductase [Mycobacterium sp. TY815]MDP7703092.1 FAD-binding oxidoreductase [Mycobacterium sp. TY815]